MGQPALSEGVKCTYFVLRKDFQGAPEQSGKGRADSLPPPPSEGTAAAPGRDEEAQSCSRVRRKTAASKKAPPELETTMTPSPKFSHSMAPDIVASRHCKHLISQSLGDESGGSSGCEFCRGERLVEEAARNNDLLAEEDDLLSLVRLIKLHPPAVDSVIAMLVNFTALLTQHS